MEHIKVHNKKGVPICTILETIIAVQKNGILTIMIVNAIIITQTNVVIITIIATITTQIIVTTIGIITTSQTTIKIFMIA